MFGWSRSGAFIPVIAGALGCSSNDLPECERNLRVCSIDDPDCQEHVFRQTACARDYEGGTVPEVQSITRDEFADLLRGDEEPTAEELRQDVQSATWLRMLDLLQPGSTSSSDSAIDSYAKNVLAYYSHVDGIVTIIETNLGDAERESAVFVLSHEFVHAQQDQQIGLQDFTTTYATSTDSDMAVRSLVEGEAMLFSNLTMARRPGASVSHSSFDAHYEQMQQDLRQDAADPEAAEFTELTSLFQYAFGGQLATDEFYRSGAAGVLELYDAPPASSAAVLRTLAGDSDLTLDIPPLSASTLPESWSVIDEDTLGAWIVYVIARRGALTDSAADSVAADWAGDHLLVAGGPTDADVALAWTVRFGAAQSAAQFVAIGDVTPPEGVRSIEQVDTDVRIIMAVDEAALATWQATFEHAVVEPGPQLQSRPLGRGVRRRLGFPVVDR